MKKKSKKKSTAVAPMPSGKSEADYMAEDDMNTMMKAEEIKMDPKRMDRMMGKMAMKAKAMTSVMGMGGMGKMDAKMGKKDESHEKSLKKHIKKSKMGGM